MVGGFRPPLCWRQRCLIIPRPIYVTMDRQHCLSIREARLGHRGSFRRRSGRRAYSNEPKIRPRVSAIYCTMVLVDTLVSGVHNEGHVECCGHADEFGERIDSHLPHDLASVGFHSDLADTERLLRTLRSLRYPGDAAGTSSTPRGPSPGCKNACRCAGRGPRYVKLFITAYGAPAIMSHCG
jgi:hypothetical protein